MIVIIYLKIVKNVNQNTKNIGKLLGKKIIFIESWSRIYKKSSSGKFAYLFANLFFVQWPEMKKQYPKAIYAGRLR